MATIDPLLTVLARCSRGPWPLLPLAPCEASPSPGDLSRGPPFGDAMVAPVSPLLLGYSPLCPRLELCFFLLVLMLHVPSIFPIYFIR